MADIHPPPGPGEQMPQATGAGSAPVPYQGQNYLGQPFYAADLGPMSDAAGDVMNGIVLGGTVSESAVAHSIPAGLADAPYEPGSLAPVQSPPGDGDADDTDDVRGDVQGAVDAATARWRMHEQDTHAQGSTIGDLMVFPPAAIYAGGVGNVTADGGFYDPPRDYGGGAEALGVQGAPGYGGEQGIH